VEILRFAQNDTKRYAERQTSCHAERQRSISLPLVMLNEVKHLGWDSSLRSE